MKWYPTGKILADDKLVEECGIKEKVSALMQIITGGKYILNAGFYRGNGLQGASILLW